MARAVDVMALRVAARFRSLRPVSELALKLME
jgi:hypothetical protein